MIYNINGGIIYNNVKELFSDNMELDYKYDSDSGANYTVLRVYKNKTDGSQQYPFVRIPNPNDQVYSALDVARNEGWNITINAGLGWKAIGLPIDGVAIENSVLIHDAPTTYHVGSLPLTIDGTGNLSYANADATGAQLLANGIVSAILGFCPIIVDYSPVDPPTVEHVDHWTENAQRQIIGQFGNGDYAIVTCEGRSFDHSDGWTIAEAQTVCQQIGLKFAYNLDGGGSTETCLFKKQINTIYQEPTGRKLPSFIVFNGANTFGLPNT